MVANEIEIKICLTKDDFITTKEGLTQLLVSDEANETLTDTELEVLWKFLRWKFLTKLKKIET